MLVDDVKWWTFDSFTLQYTPSSHSCNTPPPPGKDTCTPTSLSLLLVVVARGSANRLVVQWQIHSGNLPFIFQPACSQCVYVRSQRATSLTWRVCTARSWSQNWRQLQLIHWSVRYFHWFLHIRLYEWRKNRTEVKPIKFTSSQPRKGNKVECEDPGIFSTVILFIVFPKCNSRFAVKRIRSFARKRVTCIHISTKSILNILQIYFMIIELVNCYLQGIFYYFGYWDPGNVRQSLETPRSQTRRVWQHLSFFFNVKSFRSKIHYTNIMLGTAHCLICS